MSPSRAESEKSVIQLATTLCVIDRVLGTDNLSGGKGGDDEDEENVRPLDAAAKQQVTKETTPAIPQKTLRSVWFKYIMQHFSFENVVLDAKEFASLSAAAKEYIDANETDKDTGKKINKLLSLRYFFPKVPQPNEKPKPLTNDQKAQNAIFQRRCRKLWRTAVDGIDNAVRTEMDSIKSKLAGTNNESNSEVKAEKRNDVDNDVKSSDLKLAGTNNESNSKMKAEAKNDVDNDVKSSDLKLAGTNNESNSKMKAEKRNDVDNEVKISDDKLEQMALNNLGVKKLKVWIEEDEDAELQRMHKEKEDNKKKAYKEHIEWLSKKEQCRIRMPDNFNVPKHSAMSYGRAMSAVRPSSGKVPQTTVEILAGQGFRYVHATDTKSNDFERSRRLLLEKGHIVRENFESENDYKSEVRTNLAKKEREDVEKKSKEDSDKAYDEWLEQKELRDLALKYVKFLPPADADTSKRTSSNTSLSASISAQRSSKEFFPTVEKEFSSKTYDFCVEVGKHLKLVDRTLLQEWSQWCAAVFSFNTCTVLWDSFEPVACDVHCSSYSQIRDTFMKLLRPGLDFKQTFTEYVEKLWIQEQSRSRGPSKYDNKEQYQENMALTKRQMMNLLRQMGISMKDQEMRSLVAAFDSDSNGVVTLQEFLDFTGPKRDRHGGASACLGQKCCWMTTCKITGMANAYTISAASKRALRFFGKGKADSIDQSKAKTGADNGDDDYADDYEDNEVEAQKLSGTPPKLVELKNGEKRLVVELKDRVTREKLLMKYTPDVVMERSRKYSRETSGKNMSCMFVDWRASDRKVGIKFLFDLTKDKREEEHIKTLLSNGNPPQPPKLWVFTPNANDEAELDTQVLVLNWAPMKGDLVSFYSVECSGPSSGTRNDRYIEIKRDPSDARPESKIEFNCIFSSWNDAPLVAGTTYNFRIRGFNGFGPGDYTYKSFTTLPAAPPTPRVTKLSSDSVTIRWTFSESFFKRIEDLRKIFVVADTDKSGAVGKEELAAILDDKASSSNDLRLFLKKVATSIGLDVSQGYAALFDMVESNDDDCLTWEEFESFFMSAGWGVGASGQLNASVAGSVKGSLNGSMISTSGASTASASTGIVYIVEQCESELDNQYKEIIKTTAGQATISRLQSGKSYRFRVFAMNAAGSAGPKSDSVIAHTMLEQPPVPTSRVVTSRKVLLTWKPRLASASMRDPLVIQKMLGDWAGSHGEEDGGVSIEKVFQKYDKNRSGDIDSSELAQVLSDLGVEVTEEKLMDAFNILDKNGDGVISFGEFSAWWRRDEVSYILKRSDAILPNAKPITVITSAPRTTSKGNDTSIVSSSAGDRVNTSSIKIVPKVASSAMINTKLSGAINSGSVAVASTGRQVAMSVVCYRGTNTKVEIAGLDPNRLYQFKLRYIGSKCNSILSPSLNLMTAPLPPSKPLVVYVGSNTVRLKWYAPTNGSFKYAVQWRSSATRGVSNAAEDGWATAFNGPETIWTCTTCVPDSDYDVRVCGVNCQGVLSDPSPILSFHTLPRGDTSLAMSSKNANTYFTVDCTGDICVGDTILFSERLYIKPKQTSVTNKNVNQSVASLLEDGTDAEGVYIGERTIAAFVVKDNYKTIRDHVAASNITPLDGRRFAKYRNLWLEIVWQKSSSDKCKPYDYKSGDVIERNQAQLELFEVSRCPWKEESGRYRLKNEWVSLKDSFIQTDC